MTNDANTTVVAIPSYENRIFPRLDGAHQFHMIRLDNVHRDIVAVDIAHYQESDYLTMAQWLKDRGVTVVICSGINQQQQGQLKQFGIDISWGNSGENMTVLQTWLKCEYPAVKMSPRHDGSFEYGSTYRELPLSF